jgi:hypothetical protein
MVAGCEREALVAAGVAGLEVGGAVDVDALASSSGFFRDHCEVNDTH